MPPCKYPSVPPLTEYGRLEDQTAAVHKRQEATAEAGAIKVNEEAVAPMGLKVGLVREPKFGGLVVAVIVPAARDLIHESDVEIEVERGRREKRVCIVCWLQGVREEDGEWVSGVVGEVDETLARHSFPRCISREAFGCPASPEKAVFFGRKWKVWVGVRRLVLDLVDVIPG